MSAVLDFPVDFGGVSIGDQTCRLGLKIDRSVMDVVKADEILCGHRLTGKVVLGGKGDDAKQGKIVDDMQHEVSGNFDVKRFGVSTTEISAGLTFSLADVNVSELAKLSKGSGRLIINKVGVIPADAIDEDLEGQEQIPGLLKIAAGDDWRKVPAKFLFDGAILKSLTEHGLNTLGAIRIYTNSGAKLTDIGGIGPGKAEKILAAFTQFWKDNPEITDKA